MEVISTYQMLKNLTDNWSSSYKRQIRFIDLELREFFIYVKKEVINFKDLLDRVQKNISF